MDHVRVLVVDDDAAVRRSLFTALGRDGYEVLAADGGNAALAHMAATSVDAIVLDVAMAEPNGLEVCRRLRARGDRTPILMLTARDLVDDRVAGLDAGADDYMGKPFATAELVARVRALARRGPRWTESQRSFGALAIDRDRRLVTRDGALVPLTPREFDIVALLAWRDGRVIPRDEILEAVWGDASESASASLEVLLTRIRRKLGSQGPDDIIRTVRQVGYAWVPARSKPA
jgi:two-component system, OmpR family, response regulator MprA